VEGGGLAGPLQVTGRGPLVCLVVVRDAAPTLPLWLEGAGRVADSVVALDLGVSDGTTEILEAHPLVRDVLKAPHGEPGGLGYNRLLSAAAVLRPGSVLILTTDEQVMAEDADALRTFVQKDALPGIAYGLRLLREVDGGAGYDLVSPPAFRLFSYAEGIRFAARCSAFDLVPTAIPRSRWLPTTLRIRSRIGPPGAIPPGWDDADGIPGVVRAWAPRPHDMTVLDLTSRQTFPAAEPTSNSDRGSMDSASAAPSLCVVVDVSHDRGWETVASVQAQECAAEVEIVAVTSSRWPRADPPTGNVTLVTVPAHLPVDERRYAGLARAAGDYVLFLPGGSVLLPGCIEGHMRAHELGFPIVAGTVLNGTGSRVGWASYFLEHSGNLPGRPEGQRSVPPPGCSFVRSLLDPPRSPGRGPIWEGGTTVSPARDFPVWVTHDARRVEPSPTGRSRIELLRAAFARGRLVAARVGPDLYRPTAAGRARARFGWLTTFGPLEMSRIDANVDQWGMQMQRQYRRARPWVAAATVAAWAGAWSGSAAALMARAQRSRAGEG
jgi:hypothetical protein